MSEKDERLWAALAHASILLNLLTAFLGVLTPLIIYLVYKDRSQFVARHAMQAFVFQLVWWVGGGILVGLSWTAVGFLSLVIVGILCVPIAILISLIPVAACIYGIVGALQAYEGRAFRYWLIADWVKV
ncbi:MAG TPA: DUF4870 domain-containing protein [Anaerolineales bacterium]|nr:DUF4870 domain-containing protein [Anaerolineales bacterium]